MRRDPVREWQERYARRGTRLGFRPVNDAPFFSVVRPVSDHPRIVRTRLSAGVLIRDLDTMRDGDDRVSLVLADTPDIHAWHRGRELRLRRGEATLFQADAPGRCGSSNAFAVLEITVPQAEWGARGAHPGDLLTRPIRQSSDGLQLLNGYIRSIAALRSTAARDTQEAIRGHVIDLLVLAATRPEPIGESTASAVTEARGAAVMDYVDSQFTDPGLSLDRLTSALRVSPRYAQRLFRARGTSFTAYLNEVRLQHALALLTEVPPQVQRIADVAMSVGFSDVSYFNRAFRSRFGDTPSGVRSQAQQTAALRSAGARRDLGPR
jgi:AraC-like DNA-binding protein